MIGRFHLIKLSGPGLLFWGEFIISTTLLVINLLKFSISSWFGRGRLDDSKNLSILDCPICSHIVVHNIFLSSFIFLWCYFSSFIYQILISFFLNQQKFCQFCLSSKEHLLISSVFPVVFLVSISHISALIFISSFLLVTLDFIHSSFYSSSLHLRLDLFEIFHVSQGRPVSL